MGKEEGGKNRRDEKLRLSSQAGYFPPDPEGMDPALFEERNKRFDANWRYRSFPLPSRTR
eukprot:768253-Hanusia_phi.AAC.9